MVLILEGVLADVIVEDDAPEEQSRWRRKKQHNYTYQFNWLETPLKRVRFLKGTFPDNSIEVVTFISPEVADRAALFLENTIDMPVSEVSYQDFDDWTFGLRFKPEVRAVYDSDFDRIMRYGAKGISVVKGSDF